MPPDVVSLASLSAPVLVGSLLRCLRLIDKERDYPRQVATTRAHKVNQATLLVKALQELGYADKVSYHNLLYPNERDTRAILSWLVPRVPLKETGLNGAPYFAHVVAHVPRGKRGLAQARRGAGERTAACAQRVGAVLYAGAA